MRATDLLHRDHQAVQELFRRLEQMPRTDIEARQDLLDRIADELEVHTKIEEEIFYPALRPVSGLVDEAIEEHRKVSSVVGDAAGRDPGSDEFVLRVRELARNVEHHVAEEEGPLFRDAEKLGGAELERLGAQLEERKRAVKSSLVQRGLRAAKLAAKKVV
jgi:hemerythrin superfamily protein